MFRFRKILDLLIEISYLGIIFLVPLYFAVFLPNNDIFEINKLILFKILTLFLLFFSVIKIILSGRWREILDFFDKRFIFIAIFLFSLVLVSIFSVNKEISFWGLYSRFQGLESHIYYALFFILVYLNLSLFQRDFNNLKQKINSIILTIVVSSCVVSLYAIFQYGGVDYFAWAEPALITKRAFSTLGQPNYLASYLLLTIPFSVYLFFQNKKFLRRFFIFLFFCIQVLALFFSGSRGGILGLFFSVFIFSLIYFVLNFQKVKNYFLSARWTGGRGAGECKENIKNTKPTPAPLQGGETKKIFYYFIFVCLIFVFVLFFKDSSWLNRFSELKDLKSGSIALRIEYWQAGLGVVLEKPFFGYGLDSQRDVFAPFYQSDWAIHSNVNTIPHRAHNLFLDILLTSGIAGLIAYLALLYLFFNTAWKVFRKNNEFSLLALCIGVGFSGYLFSLLFNFAVVVTQIYFWLFLAIVFSLQGDDKKLSFGHQKLSFKTFLFKLILLIILALAIFYQINQEFKYLKADHFFRGMKEASMRGNYFETLEYWGYIKDENLLYNYYEKEAGLMIANLTQKQAQDIFRRPGQLELAEILSKVKADNYFDIFLRANIYWALGERGQAEALFEQAIHLSPNMPKNYFAMAEFYRFGGEVEKSLEYYEKSLRLLPDFNNNFMNDRHANASKYSRYLIYKGMGELYFEAQDYEKARSFYQLAFRDNLNDLTLIKKIADTFYKTEDLKSAIWYNKYGAQRSPNDYFWPYVIGLLYQEAGDNDSALEYFHQALELSPENEIIQNELNKLF